jgi:hypothetical protein
LVLFLSRFPFSSIMLDATSSDLVATAGSSTSIPLSDTDMAAVNAAGPLLEAKTSPHSSVNVDINSTTVTMAANAANNARYDPAVNATAAPLVLLLTMTQTMGGTGNALVQVAVVSAILNAAKSSLHVYFEGVNWPLNKALPRGPSS